jgi:hypothetical protein
MRSRNFRGGVQLALFVVVLYIAGCGGTSTPPNLNVTTPASDHLYVTTAAGQILQFTLPLTNTSTPSVTVQTTLNAFELAVDSNGNLAVADIAGSLAIYRPPLTGLSRPTATFANGTFSSVGSIGFDTTGKLFAVGETPLSPGEAVNIFLPPFSATTTPSQTLSISGLNVGGLDSSGNLYLNTGSSPGTCGVAVLAQPYTGTPSTLVSSFCNDGGFQRSVVADQLLFTDHQESCVENYYRCSLAGFERRARLCTKFMHFRPFYGGPKWKSLCGGYSCQQHLGFCAAGFRRCACRDCV